MDRQSLISVPIQKAHVHFYDFIEEFPGLHEQADFATKQRQTEEQLKHQFLNQNSAQISKLLIVRNCFKFNERKYIDFCLDEKLGQSRDSTEKLSYLIGVSRTLEQKLHNDQQKAQQWALLQQTADNHANHHASSHGHH